MQQIPSLSVLPISWAALFGACLVIGFAAALFSRRARTVLVAISGIFVLAASGLFLVRQERFVHPWVAVPQRPPVEVQYGSPGFEEIRGRPSIELVAEANPDSRASGAHVPLEQPKAESENEPAKPSGQPRPAWMDGGMGRVGNVYRTTATAGPCFTRTECERELPQALRAAVRTYADQLLGDDKGQRVNLDMAYIRDRLVRDEWAERRETTFQTMITLHALLEFDADARNRIESNYQQSVVIDRLHQTAACGGALLGCLAILFGYLKLDTLTRGYYTGRLRLTATTAILALAAIAGLLVLG